MPRFSEICFCLVRDYNVMARWSMCAGDARLGSGPRLPRLLKLSDWRDDRGGRPEFVAGAAIAVKYLSRMTARKRIMQSGAKKTSVGFPT
jgi:hypothetical protein